MKTFALENHSNFGNSSVKDGIYTLQSTLNHDM